ncbi:hypothetical protein BDA96_07G025900 [Sorghum bicolor]|uniref:Uncharacterized protein n=2 Tax=Sorghum bicolor TaxID=4558 RepID=A0A921QI37_SORBI|nr:hypothetical protein SORBI_3007G024600 [Sorghum bicolor]KAG0522308.1 hypothetical protein BDA96_07G025900 [Sorghum bicolor]
MEPNLIAEARHDLVSSNISCSVDQIMCRCTGAVQLDETCLKNLEAEGECWREPNLQLHAQHKIWFPPMSHLQLSQMQLWRRFQDYLYILHE